MVPTGGVDRYTSRFIDDNKTIVFVNDADFLTCDGGFVSVQGMRDDIAVLHFRIRSGWFTVNADSAGFQGLSLKI